MRALRTVCLPLAACLCLSSLLAEPAQKTDDRYPATAGDSPQSALKNFVVAPGLTVEVWASEPLFQNPVALAFDEKGRAFVAETNRRRSSVPDIRRNLDWTLPNLALRTVADREAFLKGKYGPERKVRPGKDTPDVNGDGRFEFSDLGIESERIRLVEDRDGDGKAETGAIFAEGFNSLSTGVGAGVLARNGEVWYACVPDVWKLKENPAGSATREALATGFGVHVVYSGHDMHGVKFGPDGRVYWTIADCGAHVRTKEGKLINVPDTGAVFRAEPDGSNMELYAWGLRNPQSLAFNDLGDLFTGDNNADGGDKARWEHIVEGGEYGWSIGWQFLPKLGAWNSEKLWELDRATSALSLLPTVGHIGHGPAGIAYYPGTGLPDSYKDHFFYSDFPGGIRSFALKPKGASYTVDNPGDILMDNRPEKMTGKLLWNLYPSDVAFNTNGGVYVLDWVQGWEKTGKGRIFRVHDPAVSSSALVRETAEILAGGMKQRGNDELVALLPHADQRVRLAAQWELAERGDAGLSSLVQVATAGKEQLVRVHAIWALGQIARKKPSVLENIGSVLLRDADPEIQAQTAKIIGEARAGQLTPALVELVQRTTHPRVQFFTAQALGQLAPKSATVGLISLLRKNGDRDAYVRHAAALALSRCAGGTELVKFTKDPNPSVRAGVLLALRRLGHPSVAEMLGDSEKQLTLEAARAIHDQLIDSAMAALAALANETTLPAPVQLRAVNAGYRAGRAEDAQRIAELALNSTAREPARVDALEALGNWKTDLGRDRVLGTYRPLPTGRTSDAATEQIVRILPSLLESAPAPVQLAAAEAAATLKVPAAESALAAAALNQKLNAPVRAAALRALAAFESPRLPELLEAVLKESDKSVLEEARRLSAKFLPAKAVEQITLVLQSGTIREKQSSLKTLATLPPGDADSLVLTLLEQVKAQQLAAPIRLDLIEAASARADARVKSKLQELEAARDPADPLARWREAMEGGDAKLGKVIFEERAEAACLRCHKVKGVGGDVGPDLAGLGKTRNREYLLESIVRPNATTAPGYENNLITLNDGNMLAGPVSTETEAELTITPMGTSEKVKVAKSTIKQRDKVPSAMPEGLGEVLGKRDLRDVVEYLASLK